MGRGRSLSHPGEKKKKRKEKLSDSFGNKQTNLFTTSKSFGSKWSQHDSAVKWQMELFEEIAEVKADGNAAHFTAAICILQPLVS